MRVERGFASTIGETLSDNWWVLLLRGLVAVVFGILTFAQPGISLATLLLLFGAFAFADGILKAWTAITHRRDTDNWATLLLGGLVGIGIGILTLFAPGITALGLVFYIAIWAIATGVLEVVTAIRLRKVIEGEWLLALAGVASVAFGILLMLQPGVGALAVLSIIAAYAIVFGISLVALSFRLRSFAHRRLQPHPA